MPICSKVNRMVCKSCWQPQFRTFKRRTRCGFGSQNKIRINPQCWIMHPFLGCCMQSQNATHGYRDKSSGNMSRSANSQEPSTSASDWGRTSQGKPIVGVCPRIFTKSEIVHRKSDRPFLPQTINLLQMTAGSNGAEKGQRATATQSQYNFYTIGHLERSRYASRFAINQTEDAK